MTEERFYSLQKEEYKQIYEHRKLWSGIIMDWLKLMIPIGGFLFAFFSYLSEINKVYNPCFYICVLPYLGWLLFVVPLFIWRIVARHIMRQITLLYPRLLQLEENLKWEIDTAYIYNNLSKNGLNELKTYLKSKGYSNNNDSDGLPERLNYAVYQNTCRGLNISVYKPLLHVWEKLGYNSVGSRGHIAQDIMVAIVSSATLLITICIALKYANCLIFTMILSLIFFTGIIVCTIKLVHRGCHWN
jgi:hypothetical protein